MLLSERVHVIQESNLGDPEHRGGCAQFHLADVSQFFSCPFAGHSAFAAGQAGDVNFASARREFAKKSGREKLVIGVCDQSQHRPRLHQQLIEPDRAGGLRRSERAEELE